jgi:hypothetical protein
MRSGPPVGARGPAFALLVLAVGVSHLQLGHWMAGRSPGPQGRVAEPARLKADFVFELRPAAPEPVAAPSMSPAPRRAVAAAPAASSAASSAAALPLPFDEAPPPPTTDPQQAEAAPAPVPEGLASATPPEAPPTSPSDIGAPDDSGASADAGAAASAAAGTEAGPSDSASAAAGTAALPPFEWPRSTRLSYRLTGNFRGPVDGQASVEWLREGARYQVHVEVSIGPWFAPLVSRRLSSDGEIGPDGLMPRRYDEVTRIALRDPRRLTMSFDGAVVRLAHGAELPSPQGVQDTASQFVQLTWLFTTQPQRLRSGQSVQLMLALPRRVDPWVYDVLDSERLYTAAGEIDAVHVRPRPLPRPSGELTAEMWIAPELQYLPVRIVIRQDADTYVDLLLERLPQQAAPDAPR